MTKLKTNPKIKCMVYVVHLHIKTNIELHASPELFHFLPLSLLLHSSPNIMKSSLVREASMHMSVVEESPA
jgi:hypothetical protein